MAQARRVEPRGVLYTGGGDSALAVPGQGDPRLGRRIARTAQLPRRADLFLQEFAHQRDSETGDTDGAPLLAGVHKLLVWLRLGCLCLPWAVGTFASEPFLVSRWTIADGLPQSSPNALAIDAAGYLWVGTELGLARFDGTSFRVWDTRQGLPGERVTHLLATKSGLWVATEPAALALFRDGAFRTLLQDEPVSALFEDRSGTVWIATASGLFTAAPGNLTGLRAVPGGPPGTVAIWQEDNDVLLAAGSDGLFRRDQGHRWDQVPHGPLQPPITGLARVDGRLVAAARNGFWRLDSAGWKAIEEGSLAHPEVVVDGKGVGWLWSRGGGLRRYASGVLSEVPDIAGISKLVFCVLPDSAGTLWLGVADLGLLRLKRPLIDALTLDDGLPARAVHGVLEDRSGALWLGSLEAGVTRLDDGRLTHFGVEQGLPGPAVMSLVESAEGEIWVATTRGLAVLRGARFETVQPPPPAPQEPAFVVEMVAEADGAILFAQQGGVFRYRDGETQEIIPAGSAAENEFLHVDLEGNIWIGGRDLCALGARGLNCRAAGRELPRNYTRCAFDVPGGGLWFCTYGAGLCRLNPDGAMQCVSEEQGLPHRTVHNVLLDKLGWAWLPSNMGLARVALQELRQAFDDPAYTLRADIFGLDDGLPDLEFNGGVPPRGTLLRDGRLALPTMGGLALVDPEKTAAATAPAPQVDLIALVVNGVELALAADLSLAPGTDRVVFHFTAVLPRDPESVRYRYRLLGNDEAWLAAGGARTATYTGLPPGRYRFQVQASAGSSPWSGPAVLSMRLRPHFWQTWWFAAVVAVSVLLIAAFLVRLRVQRALEMERLRLRIATDLHDDLGSELSGISLASALLRDRDELPESTRRTLGEIRESTNQLLPRMRDIVWLIDPEKEGAGPLVERLRSVATSLGSGMELEFSANSEGRRLRLGMAGRRDVLLLYRELLTNIARHSAAERVRVRVEVDDDRLVLEVGDDGRGFDTGREHEGSGLRNIRRRARSLGATLDVRSTPGSGTTVRLEVPLTRSGRGRGRRRDPS